MNPNNCLCYPATCPPHFILDHKTYECVCDQNYNPSCSFNQRYDNQTCRCVCPKSEVCGSGFVFNNTLCGCVCAPKTCEKNFKLNPKNCKCECDLSVVNRSCPSGFIFSYVTCQCEVKPSVVNIPGC